MKLVNFSDNSFYSSVSSIWHHPGVGRRINGYILETKVVKDIEEACQGDFASRLLKYSQKKYPYNIKFLFPKNTREFLFPDFEKGDYAIADSNFSIYNWVILQPLCNIRNNTMATNLSAWKKKTLVFLCATSMITTSLLMGSIELIARLAFAIISFPLYVKLKPQNSHYFKYFINTFITLKSMGSGFRAAVECFTANQRNIESLRIKLNTPLYKPVSLLTGYYSHDQDKMQT